jgi:hypothetical protein
MLRLLIQTFIAITLIEGSLIGAPARYTAESSLSEDSTITSCHGMVIDSILIDNRNIFDIDKPEFDRFLFRMANRFHWTTREDVVRREVLQEVGEHFSAALAEETARNLRGRLQLYDAWIEVEPLSDSSLLMRVVTIDEWSTSLILVVERSGDVSRYRVGPAERNLFGRNYYFTAQWAYESDKGDYALGGFVGRRLGGLPVQLAAAYSGDPKGGVKRLDLTHPYYDLAQAWSYGFTVLKLSGQRDIYIDGELVGSSHRDDDGAHFELSHRTDIGDFKAITAMEYTYKFARVSDRRISPGSDSAEVGARFPNDSLYHLVQLGIGTQGTRFLKLERVDGFGYTEDFLLGPFSRVKIGRAFERGKALFDEVSLGLAWRTYAHSTMLSASGQGLVRSEKGRAVRRLFWLTSRLYNLSLPFVTFAVGADYAHDWTGDAAENLSLGGRRGGLRGFEEHFLTGNRRFVAHVEGRLFLGLRILSAYIGGVAFADMGRTWKPGETFELRDLYGSAGLGARISFERASRDALIGIDLGYSERVGWQVTIESGQFFSALVGILPLTTY